MNPSPAGKPGCLALVTFVAAAMLAAAIYLMSRWERLPGAAKAGSVVLAVLGTLLLLPFVIFVGARILIKTVFGRVAKDLEQAREQLKGAGDDMISRGRAM